MRLPDRFQEHDKPEKQYDEARLNAPHIVETVLKALRINSAGVEEVGRRSWFALELERGGDLTQGRRWREALPETRSSFRGSREPPGRLFIFAPALRDSAWPHRRLLRGFASSRRQMQGPRRPAAGEPRAGGEPDAGAGADHGGGGVLGRAEARQGGRHARRGCAAGGAGEGPSVGVARAGSSSIMG